LHHAADYLAARFTEYGCATSGQPFRALGKSYFNIVGIKWPPGGAAKDGPPPLVVGAHYDTVAGSPGADDNASGVAATLALAEALAHYYGGSTRDALERGQVALAAAQRLRDAGLVAARIMRVTQ